MTIFAIVAAGNAIALTSPTLGIGLAARALMGLGTGVGFVAGIDLVRAGRGGALSQGVYGGSTMAAAGLALMVIPQLVGELDRVQKLVGWLLRQHLEAGQHPRQRIARRPAYLSRGSAVRRASSRIW